VDLRRSPIRIHLCEPPGQRADVLRDQRMPAAGPEWPAPIPAKTGSMRADDGVRAYDEERLPPAGPKLSQHDSE
jgi:hypothetical protein